MRGRRGGRCGLGTCASSGPSSLPHAYTRLRATCVSLSLTHSLTHSLTLHPPKKHTLSPCAEKNRPRPCATAARPWPRLIGASPYPTRASTHRKLILSPCQSVFVHVFTLVPPPPPNRQAGAPAAATEGPAGTPRAAPTRSPPRCIPHPPTHPPAAVAAADTVTMPAPPAPHHARAHPSTLRHRPGRGRMHKRARTRLHAPRACAFVLACARTQV
jgi:hypothetical protein